MSIYQELHDRGFIYQETDAENTKKLLENDKITFYVGFDPTGSSLHVGHLLPIMAMRLLQQAGHIPVVLVGGATAQVGDPSGKQSARPILTKDEVAANAECLRQQLARFISVKEGEAHFVNNIDWFKDMLYIDFLRDIGSRFSVNRMLAQESVKGRLEAGLSFLEFNYSILQAYDFYVLNRDLGCRMQFGGQDQWGNMVSGVELTRRMAQQEVYCTTFPLLLDSNGQKFGKTAGGNNVWLDTSRTSVFDYYQFWRNCEDSEVKKLLCFFTSLPVSEIDELARLEAPQINRAKEILAYEATKLAHGRDEARKAYLAAGNKFGFADAKGCIATSSELINIKADKNAGFEDLPTATLPASEVEGEGMWIIKALVAAGLCGSNGDARRLVKGGGAYIDDQRITDVNMNLNKDNFANGFIILKAGKKNIKKIIIG
ncbi:tyrosine--tRNA ligase [Lentisphaerota bacterium ZTH]|nr:tyrosine--tRNA ligase [Lentisphaerota bacterium]WET05110.1 tyrosine--tRNA ligase [Lentisphaerota bacterium ZTH]